MYIYIRLFFLTANLIGARRSFSTKNGKRRSNWKKGNGKNIEEERGKVDVLMLYLWLVSSFANLYGCGRS